VAPSQLADGKLFDFMTLRADPADPAGAAIAQDSDLYLPAIRVVNL